jgi:hypothetical protein
MTDAVLVNDIKSGTVTLKADHTFRRFNSAAGGFFGDS